MPTWSVQDAMARFDELLDLARSEGPQMIAQHGVEKAVVVSIEEFRRHEAGRPDFKAYLLAGPKFDDFSIERNPDTGRTIDL